MTQIIHGLPNDRVISKGYPKITINESSAMMEIECTVPEYLAGDVACGQTVKDLFPDLNTVYGNASLVDVVSAPIAQDKLYKETLKFQIYESSDLTGGGSSPVSLESELNTQDVTIPLSGHKNYRTCWDHDLYMGGDSTSTAHFNHTIADAHFSGDSTPGADVTPEDLYTRWAWVKPGDKVSEGYGLQLFKQCTMPGVEGYQRGRVCVTVVRRCASLPKLIKAIQADYTVSNPPEMFGFTAGQWLRCGSSLKKNAGRWEHRQEFLYAPDGWQSDLYTGGNKPKATPIVGGGYTNKEGIN